MEYTLVRSKRKTVALQINAEGELIVRAPMLYSERKIKKLVEEHREWIENKKKSPRAVKGRNCRIQKAGKSSAAGFNKKIRRSHGR